MVGVGIIGTGIIASAHIEAYLSLHPRCELRALCDTTVAKVEELKMTYHFHPFLTLRLLLPV